MKPMEISRKLGCYPSREKFFAGSVLLLMVLPLFIVPSTISPVSRLNRPSSPIHEETVVANPMSDSIFQSADISGYEGELDPVLIEQSGYAASENISARTDSSVNLAYDLPLDVDRDWIADEVEASVWNLQKLYAVNGSFDDGIPGNNYLGLPVDSYPYGWWPYFNDTGTYGDDSMTAGYDSSSTSYVTVESTGSPSGPPGDRDYIHDAGKRVVWSQTVENTPYSEDFTLSFNYFYLRGPIDGDGLDPLVGNCSLAVFVDGVNVWNMSLVTLQRRGIWNSTGEIPITISGVPDTFVFEIGLVIDETLTLRGSKDYDGDPGNLEDGLANAVYITAYLDDLSFIRSTPPTAEQVQLEFQTGGLSDSFSGSGPFYASIANSSYWDTSPVPVSFTSNTSVSFDYKARIFSHRFANSSYTTNTNNQGVSFTANDGFSSELEFYAYVGYLGDYEEPSMTIVFPDDWENVTVSDPFLTDLTGDCTVQSGSIIVPTSIIDRLGWWQVKLEAPNYAKAIDTQIFDSGWAFNQIYRIGNTTRAALEIGTASQTLDTLSEVNLTWMDPLGTIWQSESLNGGVAGVVYGNAHVFGVSNSPAGEWCLTVRWNNGTEVAFGSAFFDLYHSTTLFAEPETIEVIAGEVVNGLVRYIDGDTSDYLTDGIATMTGNWSTGFVTFAPDPINNWWEAPLRTNETGPGTFVVEITATRPYYDNATCYLTIISEYNTRVTSPDAPWTSSQWGANKTITFFLEMYDFSTESWMPMDDSASLEVGLNWTDGYWSWQDDSSPGIYTLDVATTAFPSGNYLLDVNFTKPDYRPSYSLLALIVSPIATSLSIEGSSSARVDIDESLNITMSYKDSLGSPITGATVLVDEINPTTGLETSSVDAVPGENGNYSLQVTPRDAGVFTIRFLATEASSEPASTVFVLVVNDVETNLAISGDDSVNIGLTDVYNTTFRYEMLNGTGIPNAIIEIVYTGPTLSLSWNVSEIGNGDYSVEFTPSASGTYLITIAASEEYYQSASDAFFLIVADIGTEFEVLNGTADFVSFGSTYDLWVRYTNSSGYGLDSADVDIISSVPESGLSWGTAQPQGNGYFSITLTPEDANTFTLVVRANLTNHQTQFGTFTLTATAIAASLTSLNTSTSISFDQTFDLYLLYQSEDLTGLENATFTLENPPLNLNFSEFEDLGSGHYRITITPLAIGIYDIIMRASLPGYQSDVTGFTLGVSRIPTELVIAGGISSDSVDYSSAYSLTIFYQRTDIAANITGATLEVETFPAEGIDITISEVGEGYLIQASAEHIGRWTLSITGQKENYASSLTEFVLDVDPLELRVVLLSEASDVEGSQHTILVQLREAISGAAVGGANVSYRITASGTGDFIAMSPTDELGIYTADYIVPITDNPQGFTLQIRVEKENYFIPTGGLSQSFTIIPNFLPRAMPYIAGGGSGIVAVVLLVVGYRVYSSRKKRKILSALQVRRRFDDVQNIMGVIVLNKKSGLPIYSRILRGGFEESMVSAFITAITHFRSEFGMDESHWEFNVVPISDIISAVPTRNMIVAFITVRPPSKFQEISMEAYGRAAGAMFDDIVVSTRTFKITEEQAMLFNNLFLDLMDGILIERYELKKGVSVPKSMDCLVSTASQLQNGEGFRLTDLARGMASCGVEETFAYKMVMDAVDDGMLAVTNGEEMDGISVPFIDRIKQQMVEGKEEE